VGWSGAHDAGYVVVGSWKGLVGVGEARVGRHRGGGLRRGIRDHGGSGGRKFRGSI
jgi:hypothetical protein